MINRTITTEDISKCEDVAELFKEAINERREEQTKHDAMIFEYNRRRSAYDGARNLINARCTGACLNGGPTCHPSCYNLNRLNPIQPYDIKPLSAFSMGTFVCQICKQNVTFNASAGNDVNVAEDGFNQQMRCIATAKNTLDAQEDENEAAAENAAAAEKAARIAAERAGSKYEEEEDEEDEEDDEDLDAKEKAKKKKKMTTIVIIGFIAIIFIITIILIVMSLRKRPTVGSRMEL
jgi:type I restriction-modification system DNA methylase subunit